MLQRERNLTKPLYTLNFPLPGKALLLPLLLGCSVALAQSSGRDYTPQAASTGSGNVDADDDLETTEESNAEIALVNDLTLEDTEADLDIVQRGERNRALATVLNQGATNSLVTIVQINQTGGAGNVVDLNMDGEGNAFASFQEGSNNEYVGDFRATDADITVQQRGNDNFVTQQATAGSASPLLLDDGVNMTLIQEGDGNELDADGYTGPENGNTIQVTQRNGARAVLRDDRGSN